jgi:hypothetical protein
MVGTSNYFIFLSQANFLEKPYQLSIPTVALIKQTE